jgi:hypothetical protein
MCQMEWESRPASALYLPIKKEGICVGTAFSLILASLRGTGPPHPEGEAIRPAETVRMHPRAELMVDRRPIIDSRHRIMIYFGG